MVHTSIKFFSLLEIKESGIEVNADKTKHIVMSRDENAGRSHSINNENSPFERVAWFKYLGTTLKKIKLVFRSNLRVD
jgi:hypothetical protein